MTAKKVVVHTYEPDFVVNIQV